MVGEKRSKAEEVNTEEGSLKDAQPVEEETLGERGIGGGEFGSSSEVEGNDQSEDAARQAKVARDKKAERKRKPPKDSEPSPHRLTKREVIDRLLEKNQMLFELKKKNSEMELELKGLKDKWLRSMAEFENYRKRSRKEWELLKRQTKAEVILEILSVVDDFERALSVIGEKEDEFVQGIRMIYQNLMLTLERFGVTGFEALNRPFDPAFHMAVGQIESKDKESSHVVEVIQKGYFLGDTVLRPAKVIIAK